MSPGSNRGAHWPRAVVFDCDGLLVDSASCWHAAYRHAVHAAGAECDGIDLSSLTGASVSTAAQGLSQLAGAPISPEVIQDALENALAVGQVVAMAGSERLLNAVGGHLPIAVASNAPASVLTSALTRTNLLHLTDVAVSADRVRWPKPAPDVYLLACSELDVDPSDAVALEDSAAGAKAARDAGLTVIAVPSEPEARRYADLTVSRIDAPEVFRLIGVPLSSPRPRPIR